MRRRAHGSARFASVDATSRCGAFSFSFEKIKKKKKKSHALGSDVTATTVAPVTLVYRGSLAGTQCLGLQSLAFLASAGMLKGQADAKPITPGLEKMDEWGF